MTTSHMTMVTVATIAAGAMVAMEETGVVTVATEVGAGEEGVITEVGVVAEVVIRLEGESSFVLHYVM